ncbi:MAG: arginine biosynthesis bifunctional protein ArgJ [Candidatus Poribacteria bacterium]|nr:MAG: arginine biosynthesis bifunctional protein ArgJ [Candidatus Poribacteria bacterium]
MEAIRPVVGGVLAAEGFCAAGVAAEIRYRGRPDVGLLVAERLCAAAGTFTRNRFCAAPVVVSREHLRRSGGRAGAIVVNAGNANAATGEQGLQDARRMAAQVAEGLGLQPEQILVASTGVIGEPLPMDRVQAGIDQAIAAVRSGGNGAFPEAILTTDTRKKEYAVEVVTPSGPIRIGGCAKGAGMIAPNMATMLAFLTTDAAVAPPFLQQALRRAVARSFNRISVDGDTSTNDSVFLLASGRGTVVESHTGTAAAFQEGLNLVCLELAKQIAGDGEGATRLVEIRVSGARSEEEAEDAARRIGTSPLVKTAIYGNDANWGRIVMALGNSSATFRTDAVDLWVGSVQLLQAGRRTDYAEEAATAQLQTNPVLIRLDLHAGEAEATFWTCDLTEEYVRENAAYRS